MKKPGGKSFGGKRFSDDKKSGGKFKKSFSGKRSFDKKDGDRPFRKKDGDDEFKPRRRFNEGSSDKPYGKKPYGDRERSAGDKPFKKSFGDKPYGKKPYGDRERYSDDKPFKKSYGDRERSGDKPFKKSFGDKPYAKKPYGDRERYSDDKPFKKSYGDRERSGDKPYEKKAFRGDKPFGDKPFRKKSVGEGASDDNREKAFGNKSYGDEYKGFRKHAEVRRMKEELGEEWQTFDNKEEADEYVKSVSRKPATSRKRISGKPSVIASPDETIRLNRYIANTGVCSRREADDLIKAGAVKVNGKIVTELGTKVGPGDTVHYGDQLLKREQLSYVLLNKPKDYITTTEDPQERKTVMALVEDAGSERIYPVGRLDRQTTGLLLLTNDGDLAERLMHPKYGIRKLYHVSLDKNLRPEDFDRIENGFELEDGFIKADEINFVGDGTDKKEIGIALHSGRNRIVRRMFEHLGYKVVGLDRVSYAGLTKKNLPRGRWRHLESSEVGLLKMQVGGVKKVHAGRSNKGKKKAD
jgi:23S rRNA pseudouridine2605 synthase